MNSTYRDPRRDPRAGDVVWFNHGRFRAWQCAVVDRVAEGRVYYARSRVGDDVVWFDEAYGYLQLFTGDPLPDVARRSLAVEPMTCPPNAFRTGEGLIRLEPGERFVARWGIQPLD